MKLKVDSNSVVVFDLDDTLYKEVDFLRSAYRCISDLLFPITNVDHFPEMWNHYCGGMDTLGLLVSTYKIPYSVKDLVNIYRFHKPKIELSRGARQLLNSLRQAQVTLGLLTDGRDETQLNKLDALDIRCYFEKLVISESFGSSKPCKNNYLVFEEQFPNCSYTYIADNFHKDFVTANRLGWQTIGLLDSGENIHSQTGSFPDDYLPKDTVRSLDEIIVELPGDTPIAASNPSD